MKLNGIIEGLRVLKKTFEDGEILSVEVNGIVIHSSPFLRVEVPWDTFVGYLKAKDTNDYYGYLEKQGSLVLLVLALRIEDGLVLITRRSI